MKSLIQKLVETASPSGYESAIREVIRAEIASFVDELSVDALGSLIAVKGKEKTSGAKIMLSAHMDEIGIMVTHIEENGFLRFVTLGGVQPITCIGGRVRFLNGQIGVVNVELMDDRNKLPAIENLYVDIGASRREEVALRVGDVAAFDRPFTVLGDRLVSKAMDDRIGCAVLVETLRRLKDIPHRLYFVFSTQEEVGLRGATAAAFGVDPDIGLAIDVTGTGDTPKNKRMEVALGKGPAVKVRDGGMLADPRVVDWMVGAAETAGLPYQLEILLGGTTDARAIQLTRAGVPAGCLSIPCRYVHSPSEMVDYNDVENAVRLLLELLSRPVDLNGETG
ncbi:MAG: M42 family metallopeptidase [Omnitrophica WOR_2 bacterium]